ncbi:MAG: polyprenyl synthetase family protein [Candidatus Bathyarchaeia archaeon]|jgi:geranylgeranyl pyrophosphate synthase
MSTDEKLMEQVKAILIARSKEAMQLARQAVVEEQFKSETLQEALRYFMMEFWFDASHPTLLSMACEAVGGDSNETVEVGASLSLLAGAADIHDDIIDISLTKDSKPTVFGKFGKEIAIIASDVLWIKGMHLLSKACEAFPSGKKHAIQTLITQALFDIGSAEAKETCLKGISDLKPEDYLGLIELKVSIAAASAQVGGIIGNGTVEQIESLRQFGKTLGVLMTVRDEFIDMFELEELTNRFKNECLPLPILYAFQDETLARKVMSLLKKPRTTEGDLKEILDLVTNAKPVQKLAADMRLSVNTAIQNLIWINENHDFVTLLESSLQGLTN